MYGDPSVYPAVAGIEEMLIITPPFFFFSFLLIILLFCSMTGMTVLNKRTNLFKSTSIIQVLRHYLHGISCTKYSYQMDNRSYLLGYQLACDQFFLYPSHQLRLAQLQTLYPLSVLLLLLLAPVFKN